MSFWPKVDFRAKSAFWTPKSTFGPKNQKIGPKGDFGPKSAPFRKSDQKVKVGLSVADREPGSAASGPDRIHAQPGLPELVAFSVPLHSNKTRCKCYLHPQESPHVPPTFRTRTDTSCPCPAGRTKRCAKDSRVLFHMNSCAKVQSVHTKDRNSATQYPCAQRFYQH